MNVNATENRRVVLFSPSKSLFFLTRGEQGYAIPEVSLPSRQRVCTHLTDSVWRVWNLDVVSLGEAAPQDTAAEERYEIAEIADQKDPKADGLVGVSSSEIHALPFKLQSEARLLEKILADPSCLPLGGAPGPFSHFGWFEELKDWTERKVSDVGMHLTGPFRQLTAGASFALVRWETTRQSVWFKAVGPPNLHEYAVTAELGKSFPQFVPKVIAFRPDWHGWLSVEAPGVPLSVTGNGAEWQTTAKALAELQILSLSQTAPLLSSGARDVRIPRLISQLDWFFENLAYLTSKQVKLRPAPLTVGELGEMRVHLEEVLFRLGELDLPDALGHLDLNPENVLVSHAGCTFLDWAEAAVGLPFFTLQYFLEHFRLAFPQAGELEREFVSAYADRWDTVVSKSRMQTAMPLIPAATVYAYTTAATAGRNREFLEQPNVAASFRSMGRRLNREPAALRESAAAR